MSFEKLKQLSFEEKDVENFTKIVNMMHSKIQGLDGKEAFEYFSLMSWAQNSMLPKLKEHIMGEPQVVKPKENKKEKK